MALNGIQRPEDAKSDKEKILQASDEKYKNIFSFLYGINQDVDLFQKYRVDRIFEFRILSVDQNYRGQGLAKRLLEKSLEVAQNGGFKVINYRALIVHSTCPHFNYGLLCSCLNRMLPVSTLRRLPKTWDLLLFLNYVTKPIGATMANRFSKRPNRINF